MKTPNYSGPHRARVQRVVRHREALLHGLGKAFNFIEADLHTPFPQPAPERGRDGPEVIDGCWFVLGQETNESEQMKRPKLPRWPGWKTIGALSLAIINGYNGWYGMGLLLLILLANQVHQTFTGATRVPCPQCGEPVRLQKRKGN